MTDRYAVFGNPVAHSQSPWIHRRFAAVTGQNLCYDRVEVPLQGFREALRGFIHDGGKGLNITVPFKQDAFDAVDQRSIRAERAGAVNTIKLQDDGSLLGDNTDGLGLVRDLRDNHGVGIRGRRLLLLGAGGAVRGVLGPLAAQGPAELVIANRRPFRAEALLPLCEGIPCKACGFEQLPDLGSFDLVINGTSASLAGGMPPLPEGLFNPGATAHDMVYGARPSPFLAWSANQGAALVLDGLGMLVEQAAESFLLWRGVRPQTADVIGELRKRLANT